MKLENVLLKMINFLYLMLFDSSESSSYFYYLVETFKVCILFFISISIIKLKITIDKIMHFYK